MANTKDILQKYIDVSISGDIDNQKMSFFILNGPQNTGKSQIAQDIIQDILGQYFANDFLHIRDFSTQLKKNHTIKVAKKDDETYKTLMHEYQYKDIGTREINLRLQQSSVAKTKVVLIENIERMSIGAINAFLKTCEEPLPNRLIIATTSNKSQILDTVISRAIIVDTHQDESDTISSENKQQLSQDLSSVVKILSTDTNIHNKHKVLSDINKKGLIKPLLDELIAYYISNNDFDNSEKRLEIKKMSQSNVNMDNLLFYGLLN